MANPELLAKLKDVHLPAEVSWWPLAIGWWLLIAIVIILIAASISYQLHKKNKYQLSRAAIKELQAVAESDEKNWLIQLTVILKRASLSLYPKRKVASLTESSWIRFLTQTGNGIWDDKSLVLLRDAVYKDAQAIPSDNKEQLFAQAKLWLMKLPDEVKNV
ncbi:MAG: DUF4381 domain-containing protein [Gammaproteobacteria bacterium]|nr:DUF4381 domain-containing protein [Gammaproteobacteria bacterium]